MIRSTVAAIALLVAAGAPAVAEERPVADAASESRATSVRQHDLDLTSERGAAAMLMRLERAAQAVCDAPEVNRPSPAARRAMAACRRDAVAEAVKLLDAPLLTQLHRDGGVTQTAYTR
ncbi:MAG: UrcA family protein [Hyphomonadaceae bacterium]|nr:UrcA family protein [Hyphomonadaceae bacterium]